MSKVTVATQVPNEKQSSQIGKPRNDINILPSPPAQAKTRASIRRKGKWVHWSLSGVSKRLDRMLLKQDSCRNRINSTKEFLRKLGKWDLKKKKNLKWLVTNKANVLKGLYRPQWPFKCFFLKGNSSLFIIRLLHSVFNRF